MSAFKLDDIRAAAEAKYGSTDIEVGDTVVRLLNPLRMSKKNRDALVAVQKQLSSSTDEGAEEVDQDELFSEALRVVAETPAQAKVLLTAIGDDLAVKAEIFARYSEGTQVGEASPSRD
ncbi:hypothetical protein M2302_002231 [Micromonospora sp. A200]|uniref:phage tail assembly protein n=1 Tax=Micromonospora sp. A200 TaxID=2940568 RepID=UPI0024758203|nr:phage tail assembly protein [Micromonospora sp. A200]MDH6462056.1 hypothetical protein [Micromonospora sp. A200]